MSEDSAKAPAPVPGKNGFKYRPQYGVIVLCADEAEHRRVYEELTAQGRKCRVVCA